MRIIRLLTATIIIALSGCASNVKTDACLVPISSQECPTKPEICPPINEEGELVWPVKSTIADAYSCIINLEYSLEECRLALKLSKEAHGLCL